MKPPRERERSLPRSAPPAPPKPRRVVADTRRQRALDAILVDHDFPTAAGVIATLPAWMRPYFRAWDR